MANHYRSDDAMVCLRYRELAELDYGQLVGLIRPALSGSTFGLLGAGFIDYFYKSVARRPDSYLVGAFDESNKLLGVAIAVIDHNGAYSSIMRKHWFRLALRANFHILTPGVLTWIARGLVSRTGQTSCRDMDNIKSRLLVISVDSGCMKQGVGSELINKIDEWFRSVNIPSYLIFTEKSNIRANRLYKKNGCEQLCIRNYRSKQIVVWVRHTHSAI